MIKALSLFTGGGLCDIGLRGIVDFVAGVEYDPTIAAHATKALCQKCHNALDAPMRARHRKEKAEASRACRSLFSEQEGTL